MRAWAAANVGGLGLAAIGLTVLAMAIPIQNPGCAQKSTYALVKALHSGTARIDPYEQETCDKAYRHGHFYSNKAPGLAFTILPAYSALDATRLLPRDPRVAIWLFSLWSSVLPAAVMLLLARRIAGRFDAATGTLVAVALGLTTLTFPLATVGFGHVLAATLLLASFAIALDERQRAARWWLLLAAGALAGFAVTTEYPAALVASVVGLYAAAGTHPVRRLAAFAAGGLAGVLPLLVYNQWAFGAATSLSYASAVSEENGSSITVGHHDQGFYGVQAPSLSALVRVLLADRGMLAVTPIMAAGVIGLILLYRRGLRAEATAIGAVGAVMLIYNGSLTITPTWVFGGDSPGPRYAYLAFPFVALPLGLAFRRFPSIVTALLTVSLFRMTLGTATQPMVGSEGTAQWLRLIRVNDFTNTFLSYVGLGHGWLAILPFLLVVALATLCAIAAMPLEAEWFSAPVFITTVAAWAFVAITGSALVASTGAASLVIGLATLATGCLLVYVASTRAAVMESDTPRIPTAR